LPVPDGVITNSHSNDADADVPRLSASRWLLKLMRHDTLPVARSNSLQSAAMKSRV
jgi:hypothetical protein